MSRSERRVTEHAVEMLPAAASLSDEWRAARRDTVSASEVAAILGLSPWVSAFDLWWEKRTGEESQDESRSMRRGRRREAAILEDFADEHPEFSVARVGLVRNDDRPWQTCTPDALAYEGHTTEAHSDVHVDTIAAWTEFEPVAVVEAKTDGGMAGWGDDGTDEIPVHYRAQVLWQMDTLGLGVAYVPVWFGFGYREYQVAYDEADVKLMREAAETFLASVREDRQPDLDAHEATGRRLRKLHPSVVDGQAEVPAAAVAQWRAADRLEKAAAARRRLAENRIRQALGDYRVAVVAGERVFTRSVYDVKERTQTVRGFTVNRLNHIKPKEARP